MVNRRTLLTAVSTVTLGAFGIAYVLSTPDPDPRIIGTILLAVAGLGGYELRGRSA